MSPLLIRPALLVAAVLVGGAVSAQPMWRTAPGGASVSLDVLKPFGNDLFETDPRALNSAQVLSARVPVRPSLTVVASLPLAYLSYDAPEGVPSAEYSVFGIGNPYLGAERSVRGGWTFEAGGRLPFATFSGPEYTGGRAVTTRAEAFRSETASVVLGARLKRPLNEFMSVRFRVAPTVLYSARDFEGSDFDHVALVGTYGLHAVGSGGRFEVEAGIEGQEAVALQERQFGRVRAAVVGAGGAVVAGPLRPGLSVQYPIRGEFLPDVVVALSLDVSL